MNSLSPSFLQKQNFCGFSPVVSRQAKLIKPTNQPDSFKNFLLVKAEKVASLGCIYKVLSNEDSHVSQQAQVRLTKKGVYTVNHSLWHLIETAVSNMQNNLSMHQYSLKSAYFLEQLNRLLQLVHCLDMIIRSSSVERCNFVDESPPTSQKY